MFLPNENQFKEGNILLLMDWLFFKNQWRHTVLHKKQGLTFEIFFTSVWLKNESTIQTLWWEKTKSLSQEPRKKIKTSNYKFFNGPKRKRDKFIYKRKYIKKKNRAFILSCLNQIFKNINFFYFLIENKTANFNKNFA